jgi:hypothetical protein
MRSSIVRSSIRALLFLCWTILTFSCSEEAIPVPVAGTWSSTQVVSVRLNPPGKPYGFVRDSVRVSLTIRSDRTVEGSVGHATLEEATITRNRGAVGHTLDLNTDFLITGKLVGNIFPADTLDTKNVTIPFNVENGALAGTIFQNEGMGIFPMVNVRMTRN